MKVYGWKTEEEARKNVKVYGAYEELLEECQGRRHRGGDYRLAACICTPRRPSRR